jgi:hypothetical protein
MRGTLLRNLWTQCVIVAYPFLAFAIVSRVVGPEEYSQYLVLTAVGAGAAALIDGGMQLYLVPRCTKAITAGIALHGLVKFALIWRTCLLVAVGSLVALIFSEYLSFSTWALVAVVSSYGVASALNFAFLSYAHGDPGQVTKCTLTGRLFSLVAIIVFAVAGVSNWIAYLFLSGFASLATSALLIAAQAKRVRSTDRPTDVDAAKSDKGPKQISSLPREAAWRLSETAIIVSYTSFVAPVAAGVFGALAVSVYVIAERMVRAYQALMYAHFLTLHPQLSRADLSGREALEKLYAGSHIVLASWLPLPLMAILGGRILESILHVQNLTSTLLALSPLALIGTFNGVLLYSIVAPRRASAIPLIVLATGAISCFVAIFFLQTASVATRLSIGVITADVIILIFSILLATRRKP